jgi:hypothetical protein
MMFIEDLKSSCFLLLEEIEIPGIHNRAQKYNNVGVCSKDLWLDTSTKGLKQFYRMPLAILEITSLREKMCLNIIYNFNI